MRGRKRIRKKKLNRFLDMFLAHVAESVGMTVRDLGKPIPWNGHKTGYVVSFEQGHSHKGFEP